MFSVEHDDKCICIKHSNDQVNLGVERELSVQAEYNEEMNHIFVIK